MLTTTKAISEYRLYHPPYINVIVKALPEGVIKQLRVTPYDTVFHLYNMFLSHTKLGTSTETMLLFPTNKGLYELDNTIAMQNEYQIADLSGYLPLSRYRFTSETNVNCLWQRGGNVVCLMFFRRYLPLKAINSIRVYMERNSDYRRKEPFTVFASPDEMPSTDEIREDEVQTCLREIMTRQLKDRVNESLF
jgi:hypothetical protein